MAKIFNPALAFVDNSKAFKKYSPKLQAFVQGLLAKDPKAQNDFLNAVDDMESKVWVDNMLFMLIELAGRGWRISQHTIHHLKLLDIESGAAKVTQMFDTDKNTSKAYVCNLNEPNKMSQDELFFANGISLDYKDDLVSETPSHPEAILRLEQESVVKILVRSKEYFRMKACQIHGINPTVPQRSRAKEGKAASADEMRFIRGDGKPTYFGRFLRLGPNIDFETQFATLGTTAHDVDGHIELALHGIHAQRP